MVDETVGILTSVMVEKEGGIMSEQTISINVETDGTVALGIAGEYDSICFAIKLHMFL